MRKTVALILSLVLGVTFFATGASASTATDSFTAAMTKMSDDAMALSQAMPTDESETPDVAAVTAAIDTVIADIAAVKTAYGSLSASEKTELGLDDDFASSMDQMTSLYQAIKLMFTDYDAYEPVGTAFDDMSNIDFSDFQTTDAGLISAAAAAYSALTAEQKEIFDSLYAITSGVDTCQVILDAYSGMAANITAIKPLLAAMAELDEMSASVDDNSQLTTQFTVKLNALQAGFTALSSTAKTALDSYSTINGGATFTQQLADYKEIAPALNDDTNNNNNDSDDNGNPKTGDTPIAGMLVLSVLALGAVCVTKKRK